jgi:putative ABC transport system permease protein
MDKLPPKPPGLFLRFFRWFSDPRLRSPIEGDLMELYIERVNEIGKKKADRKFTLDVLQLFRPDIIRPVHNIFNLNNYGMFKNYFKIAWRNIFKHKMYSLINISGLTIGMTCFILIALFIQFELSFDSHHEKADRIYRIGMQQKGNEFRGTDLFAVSPRPLGIAIKNDFPEVEAVTNIDVWGALLRKDNESFSERGLYADSHLFDVFTIPVLEGMGREALNDVNNILLTESSAKKIFGSTSALEKTLIYGERELTVKGIVADPPKNQHISYTYISSIKIKSYYEYDLERWVSNDYYTYFVLAEGYDYKALEEKIKIYEKNAKLAFTGVGFSFYPEYILQPLRSIHLHSNMNMEIGTNGDINYVYFFAFIAFIILILASINYVNLATAKSAQRGKEVGISKVLGAQRSQLILQFLSESFLFSLAGFLLALVLTIITLPLFSELLATNIPFDLLSTRWIFLGMLTIAIMISSLSGLYPALFLSSVSPIKALKGNFLKSLKDRSTLRNSLVVGQFVVAIVLAIGSLVIHQQLQFTQSKKLGYNKSQVVHVPYWEKEIAEKEEVIREQLLAHSKIHKVSMSTQLPMDQQSQGPIDTWEGNGTKDQIYIYRSYVDYDFIDLFEMELVEGRGFSKDFVTDSAEAYVLNETAIKKLGWKTAIGKKFYDGKVIGVVKDFHLQTFDLTIEPLYMTMRREGWHGEHGQVMIKIDMDDFENTRDYIIKTLEAVAPYAPYEVQLLEDSYAALYDKESRLAEAFNIFSVLALFIAGMGLFGIVSFQVLQRTKEIGIRKVLGSSVSDIIGLLSKDFLKLVVISLVIAVPIAYYTMNLWLEDYVYRINIQWWVFVLIGLGALGVAFVTVSFQSVKAALSNPVDCLQEE